MSRPPREGGPGPLTGLAGRLRRTIDALHEADEVQRDATATAAIDDRLNVLTLLVGQERPRTPAEALLQLAVASGTVECLVGNLRQEDQIGMAREIALVNGCLYGVRGLLEELAGGPLDELVSSYWMTAAGDPHRVLDRLAAG